MALTHGGNIFAIAREHGWDWRDVLDFSANINPLGPAPGVAAAIHQAIERIVHYPDREAEPLRRALANKWNVEESQILLGNGATELIFFLARMHSASQVTLAQPVFSEFYRAFPFARIADLTNRNTWPSDGLLVLTRPANPTGWTLGPDTLKEYLSSTSNPVLIDESFIDFSGSKSATNLLEQFPQLLILRSLTKFYALPGLRIGGLIGSTDIIQQWSQLREPWQVNVLVQEAALAAICDEEHAARSREFVMTERAWLFGQLHSVCGLQPAESDANFFYIRLGASAQSVYEHMLRHKILMRVCTGWPGLTGESVRIAIRGRSENERLLRIWREFRCD